MAVGVKLLHIVSDNIGLYCPRFERCGDESVWVSKILFVLGNRFSCCPSCLNMMRCPALSVSRNSLKH